MSALDEARDALAVEAFCDMLGAEIALAKRRAEHAHARKLAAWKRSPARRFALWLRKLADKVDPAKPGPEDWRWHLSG